MSTRLLSIRFDTELVEYLEERAKREHRSLSNMIIDILLREKERDVLQNGYNISNLFEPKVVKR